MKPECADKNKTCEWNYGGTCYIGQECEHQRLGGHQLSLSELESDNARLRARVEELGDNLKNVLISLDELAAESYGVAGLHLNGDIATWGELLDEGHMSAWLGDAVVKARAALEEK